MKRMICLALCFLIIVAMPAQNTIVLSKDTSTHIIDRNIYGHFAEHLGRCIYGGFYVGEGNKKIPNTNGVRNDVVAALKKLKIPNLRWPGGCFADTYHWKDGIGPKDKRPSMVNKWWGGVTENNSFGTHDFLNMCELLGAEPYIAANIGSGTVQELIDWVQYVSYDGKSPMSALRRENGRHKPWNVKYWGIGNEAWGCGGNMRPEYYADLYRKYATFIAGWSAGNKIFRIASGANSSDYKWTETLMKNIPLDTMEGIGLHHYAVIDWNRKSPATDFTEPEYFTSMKRALFINELITKNEAILDKYDPGKKTALVVDEWGGWYDVEPGTNPGFLYQQNTMRDAMIAGTTLNIFNNHSERVRMANLAQTINVLQAVILTNEEKMILTGKPAPFIRLKNIDDQTVSFDDYPSANGFIVVFISNTCPYSKAYEQRIIDLDKKYSPRHFPVIAVNPNDPELSPGDSFIKMKEHAKSRHYTFPYLYDEGQVITNLYGARSTPHVFVVSKNAGNYTVEYTGAIDNDTQNNNPGKINYAEDAVSGLLNNKKPAITVTRAVGCSISRKKN